jgi:hypothetical protein
MRANIVIHNFSKMLKIDVVDLKVCKNGRESNAGFVSWLKLSADRMRA